MHAIAPKLEPEPPPSTPSTAPRCAQCGELIEKTIRLAHPNRELTLCVDCAFEDMPCTD